MSRHRSSSKARKPLRALLTWLALITLAYQCWIFGHILWYREHPPGETAFMSQRLQELRKTQPAAKLHYRWVAYERISRNMKKAAIAAEDARFLEHNGFDWDGMQDALERNVRKGRIIAGGSTISQQLAKNLFLSPARNPLRKIEEAIITVMLEQTLSKRRILELYLNVVEWGERQYGIEAAAQHYFGVSAAALNPAQAARLAGMIPSPRYYQRHFQSRSLARKTSLYLQRMPQARIP